MANRMASAIANRMANLMASAWQKYAPNPNPNPNPNPASACACLLGLFPMREIIIVKAVTHARPFQTDDDSSLRISNHTPPAVTK